MMPAVRPRRGSTGDDLAHTAGSGRHAANAGNHLSIQRRTGADVLRTSARQSGPLAGLALADQLRQAWVRAGKPHMADVGYEVGYSKATISKVLSGKMAPAWHLVRKLGVELGVPPETVQKEWHPLWIAADNFRRGVADHPDGSARRASGHACARCGSWVVDTDLHAGWHLRLEPPAEIPPARMTDSHEWANLRDAVARRDEIRRDEARLRNPGQA